MLIGQWESVQPPAHTVVKKVFNQGDTYYAVTNYAVYKSENYGQTWDEFCRYEYSSSFRNIRHRQDTIYYLTSPDIILRAYVSPTGTCDVFGPFPNIQIADFVLTDSGTIITNGQAIQRLDSQNNTWETVANLSYFPSTTNVLNEPVMDYSNGTVWMYGDQGIMRSDDHGINWEILNDTLNVYSMYFSGDTILCETAQLGTMRSFDSGQNWTVLGNNYDFQGFCQSNGLLYGNHTVQNNILSKIYVSSDFGETWTEIPTQPKDIFIKDLLVKGNLLFCAAEFGVVRSDDGGQSWAYSNTGLEGILFGNSFKLSSLGDYVLYVENATTHFSKNGGQTWDGAMLYNYSGFTELNGNYYTGPPNVYKSSGDIKTWTNVVNNFYGTTLVFTLENYLGAYLGNSILRSSDEGLTWSLVGNIPVPNQPKIHHNSALFSWNTSNIVVSTDFGANWQQTTSQGLPLNFNLHQFYSYEDKLLAIDTVLGLFLSDDNAENWSKISDGLIPLSSIPGFNYPVILMEEAGILVVNTANEVMFSPDFGQTWGYFQTGIQATNAIHTGTATNNAFYLAAGETQIWRRDFSTANLYSVSGTVFNDENNNGLKEPDETGLPGVVIALMPSELYTATGLNGGYAIAADAINDTIRPIVPIIYAEANPSFHTAINTTTGLDFGIHLQPGIKDLSVSVTPNAPFRPGFSNLLTLTYANEGTTVQNGILELQVDNQLEIENIMAPPTNVNGNALTWDFTDLQIFERRNISVTIKTPASIGIGTPLTFTCLIDTSADFDTTNNFFSLLDNVIGSFDPNDKQVVPSIFTPESLANKAPLTYTIRFQNTGNFPASFITLADTLSQNLDPATFRVLASSHPMTWTMEGSGIVKFQFENINLSDSTTNEPASHGFVKYAIQAKPGLQLGDEIENTAHIYFDFNEPVVTNTITTKVALNENDNDGDGFQVSENDCDDSNSAIYPGAIEICDGLDDDCNGQIPNDELDADLDGLAYCQGDCDDSNAIIYPGAVEIPNNGIDEDCNGIDLTTPTNEFSLEERFTVSPNPFSNIVVLSCDCAEQIQYTLLNAFGTNLKTGTIAPFATDSKLYLGELPPGVYLLMVSNKPSSTYFAKRLVKVNYR